MDKKFDLPRLVISGTHSGVGKTTIATALMAALRRRGRRVQAFKAGPDFIDPTFHSAATGRPSRNLDGWMLTRKTNLEILTRSAADSDIAIIEGVMGLFDGRDGIGDAGSTAEIAKWLKAPVVLIVDGSAMARSAAALVHGFETFDRDVNVAGVVFNRLAGKPHYEYIRGAVDAFCGAKPLGYLVSDPRVTFPERHLGLLLAAEVLTPARLETLANWIENSLDVDELLALAAAAPSLERHLAAPEVQPARGRIGIARDRAFCFYYQDNLDILAADGWQLVEFSPLWDPVLPPDLNALYLGGGYPELHAAALSSNTSMLQQIRDFAAPIYAECGGFMYLCEAIIGMDGVAHSMAGIFPTQARMQPKPAALGYVEIEGDGGGRIRGHQFRYSIIEEMPNHIARSGRHFIKGTARGSYVHLHFGSNPKFAASLFTTPGPFPSYTSGP